MNLNEIHALGHRMKQMKKVTEALGMHSENHCAPNSGWDPASGQGGVLKHDRSGQRLSGQLADQPLDDSPRNWHHLALYVDIPR